MRTVLLAVLLVVWACLDARVLYAQTGGAQTDGAQTDNTQTGRTPRDDTAHTKMPVGKASWYYSLGGAAPVLNFSDGADVTRFDLFRGEAKWNLDACNFDLKKSVQLHLNDVRRNLYALERNIVDSARSLLRTSALSVLQRANPGLYDMLTRGIANAQLGFDVAVKNCEQMRRDIAADKNPLYGWLRLAAHARWTATDREIDPALIDKSNKTNPGSEGIPWVDGTYAGGEGQPPIAITADVIRAGYRYWYGMTRNGTDNEHNRLRGLWGDVEEAVSWAQEVLGETRLRFCVDCEAFKTEAGRGLQAELARGQRRYTALLKRLVRSDKRPLASELSALSANGMRVGVNMAVLQALKNEAPANRNLFVERLAAEIALSDAVEKALIARQLLYAGAASPNIANNGQAQLLIKGLQERLHGEMNNVLFEHRVRSEVLTGTARMLLARTNAPLPLPAPPGRLGVDGSLPSDEVPDL